MTGFGKRIGKDIRKSRIAIIITILTAIALPGKVFAQKKNIRFEHLSLEHGLSQNTIECILQDRQGFMWFGTQDGLNKYDGYKFTVYRHNPDHRTSLGANFVYSIFEDSAGILWIGTRGGGLNRFDKKQETFIRFLHQADNPHSISHNGVRSIFADSAGILWIGTDGGGLNKFDKKTGKFTRFKHQADNPHSLSRNNVWSIFADSVGTLWIGTSGGLNQFDRKQKTFNRFLHQVDNPRSLSHNEVRSIFEDSAGTLWIGTGGGLNRFDRKQETFTRFLYQADNPASLSHNEVRSIFEDSAGTLWIGTGGGLNRFDRKQETFIRFLHQADNPYSLSHNFVMSIHEDSGGNLWIGTLVGGINKFAINETFIHFQHQAYNPHSLSHNFVMAIFEDSDDNLWIGTLGGGINKFARKEETFTHFQHQAENPRSLSNNNVWSIFEDSDATLWIGTGNGLNKFNRKEEIFIHYQNQADNPYSISNNNVNSIFEDSDGTLWIGTGGGLNQFDRKQETFSCFQYQVDNPYSLSHNNVRLIFEDSGDNLWIGSEGGGLNKFDKKTGKFIRFQHQADNPYSISNNFIRSIFEDSDGNLWIGTLGGGLNKFTRNEEKFTHFREKDGLANDIVYGILGDDNGNLWMSTNKGISKFNPKTGTFINYDEKDGLQSNEFNTGAFHKGKSGRMYFGGINGFNEFYPDRIKNNTYIPRVVITDFLLFNRPVPVAGHVTKEDVQQKTRIQGRSPKSHRLELAQHINYTREITLDYRDYIFALEFSVLNYRQPEKNQFAYKLEGFDKDWIETDYKNRRATYTNLPHREYTFRVKASNDDGIWNHQGTSIKITILPPFWKTLWFQSLVFFVILAAIYGLYRLRVHNMKAQQIKLEKQVADRTAELRQRQQELQKSWKVAEENSRVAEKSRLIAEKERQAAEVANRFKSNFLACMSHEIRTSMNAIIGFNEMMLDTNLNKEQQDYVLTIMRSGESLLTVINDILDFSKVESGQLALESIDFDPEVLAIDVCELINPRIGDKPVEILCRISDSVPSNVRGDPGRYRQVLINLMANAAKFTEKGEIELAVDVEKEDEALITLHAAVRDTGIGIPKDKQDFIFEAFQQGESSVPREYGGTGLGLAICKQLAQLMGGDIWLESEPGQGSIFHFSAVMQKSEKKPVLGEKGENRTEKETAKREGMLTQHSITDAAKQSTRILLVEDNPINQKLVARLLTKAGYQVKVVNNGGEAVSIYTATPDQFDIIFMDVQMPEMDGKAATRAIRSQGFAEIPIIAMTAQAMKGDREKCLEAGMNDYISKPIKREAVFAMVKKWAFSKES